MLDDFRRGAERKRLSGMHGDAGRAAGAQPAGGGTGDANRTGAALRDRALFYFRSKELFLSRPTQGLQDESVRNSHLQRWLYRFAGDREWGAAPNRAHANPY